LADAYGWADDDGDGSTELDRLDGYGPYRTVTTIDTRGRL
jgi:hypothetical protein